MAAERREPMRPSRRLRPSHSRPRVEAEAPTFGEAVQRRRRPPRREDRADLAIEILDPGRSAGFVGRVPSREDPRQTAPPPDAPPDGARPGPPGQSRRYERRETGTTGLRGPASRGRPRTTVLLRPRWIPPRSRPRSSRACAISRQGILEDMEFPGDARGGQDAARDPHRDRRGRERPVPDRKGWRDPCRVPASPRPDDPRQDAGRSAAADRGRRRGISATVRSRSFARWRASWRKRRAPRAQR